MPYRSGTRRRRAYWAEPLEPRVLLATVSGTVYNDVNADAARNPFTEPGLAGWTVYVDGNENGVLDGSELNTASAASGAWSITSAAFRTRDTYHVRIVNQSTWRPTEPAAGEYAVSFSTTSETVSNLDFGQTRRALVTGTVFHDTNEDGTWDREPVQSGRTVFADANNNNGVLDAGEGSAVSNENGDYALSPAAGTYTIRQVQQAGWWQTFPSPPSAGHPLTLSTGQTVSARHFGNIVATVDLLGAGFAVTTPFDPVPEDGQIDVFYQVRNTGTADSAPYRVAFYLSDDATITTSDTLLRSVAQSSAPRHTTVDRTTPITLPRPDPFRSDNQYYVGMIIDSEADVAETNETNNANQGVLADRYPVSSEADLPMPVDNANVHARPITVGGSAAGVIGDEWIGGYDQDIYRLPVTAGHNLKLTVDQPGGSGFIRLYNSSWTLLEIAAGMVERSVAANDTYYVVISSGGNGLNDPRRVSGRVQGPTGPYTLSVTSLGVDLVGDRLTVDGETPETFYANLRIKQNSNSGRSFNVSIYLSDDEQVTTADLPVGSVRVTPAEFDSEFLVYSAVANLTVPPDDPFHTDNQYWFGMFIDSSDEVAEGNEGNNVGPAGSRLSEETIWSPADVTRLRSSASLSPGGVFHGEIGEEWIGTYDQDVFAFQGVANEVVQIDVDRTGGALDSYVRLYNTDWVFLAANDNGVAPDETAGTDSFLRYTLPATGQYRVVVGGSGNHTNHPLLLIGRTAATTGTFDISLTTQPAGPVTGEVFGDSNGNGVRDPGEVGVQGQTVFLDLGNDGGLTPNNDPTALTGPDGSFTFIGVRSGSFPLRLSPPPGFLVTTPFTNRHPLVLASGVASGPYSFGITRATTVSGTLYNDADGDGTRDVGESALPGHVAYVDTNRNGVRDLSVVTLTPPGLPSEVHPGSVTVLGVEAAGLAPRRIADVDVTLDGWEGDFRIRLISALGQFRIVESTPVGLFERVYLTFDDEGPHSFERRAPVDPLHPLDGAIPDGWWYFLIEDLRTPGQPRPARVDDLSIVLTLSEPFATTDAAGGYSIGGLLPGNHLVRTGAMTDWIDTAPPGGAHDRALAEGQAAAGLDFGRRRRVLQVDGAHLFYNNSAFDGRDPAAGVADDAAIAPDKTPAAAGAAPSVANVTSYVKGINGVMIDVHELSAAPTLADFSFKAPSSFNPAIWVDLPAPTGFAVRNLNDPADATRRRVSFIWPDNFLRNVWVQVSVLANAATRRAAPAVFYVGNLVGETGDALTPTRVTAADLTATRAASSRARVTLSNRFDHNRDGLVNILDQEIVRGAMGHVLPVLVPPTSASPASAAPSRTARPPVRTGWTAGLLDERAQ